MILWNPPSRGWISGPYAVEPPQGVEESGKDASEVGGRVAPALDLSPSLQQHSALPRRREAYRTLGYRTTLVRIAPVLGSPVRSAGSPRLGSPNLNVQPGRSPDLQSPITTARPRPAPLTSDTPTPPENPPKWYSNGAGWRDGIPCAASH